jgi:hypothetical protein
MRGESGNSLHVLSSFLLLIFSLLPLQSSQAQGRGISGQKTFYTHLHITEEHLKT